MSDVVEDWLRIFDLCEEKRSLLLSCKYQYSFSSTVFYKFRILIALYDEFFWLLNCKVQFLLVLVNLVPSFPVQWWQPLLGVNGWDLDFVSSKKYILYLVPKETHQVYNPPKRRMWLGCVVFRGVLNQTHAPVNSGGSRIHGSGGNKNSNT